LGEKDWPYQQIERYNSSDIYPLLLQAASIYHGNYLSKANSVVPERNRVMMDLLYRQ
jgi:hypothetical protein